MIQFTLYIMYNISVRKQNSKADDGRGAPEESSADVPSVSV